MRLKILYIMGECLPLYKITHFLIMYKTKGRENFFGVLTRLGVRGSPVVAHTEKVAHFFASRYL